MAKQATIPITDDGSDGVCTSYYSLRLKLHSASAWTVLPNQYGTAVGSPAVNCIVLNNLANDAEYDAEITRHCCTGSVSSPAVVTFTATNT